MKYLYCNVLLLMSMHILAMEDLDEVVPDFIPLAATQQHAPIFLPKDRIMADLPLMKIPSQKDYPWVHLSASDSEISLVEQAATRIVCVLCNKTFARTDTLLRHHKNQHTESEKIPCTISECSKIFTAKSSLDVHLKRTHKLHPKTLKRYSYSDKSGKKNSRVYQTNKYQSLAMRNAKRMPTRNQS